MQRRAAQSAGRVPPAPPGKSGWPWAAPPCDLAEPNQGFEWPRISVVTPSFNQAHFIEETIRSILLQGYPNLEYIVIDGGSTDGSVEIIREYEPWISYWVSEPDRGMYDAINKGFARATGEIMAWSNTDDVYLPGAFHTIASVFRDVPDVEWVTSLWKVQWDENSRESRRYRVGPFNCRAFYRGRNLPGSNPLASFTIQQQSTFWSRGLWERSGARVEDRLALAGDFELWARFFRHAELFAIDEPIGVFRFQPRQKTATQGAAYLGEAKQVLRNYGGGYPGRLEGWLRTKVLARLPEGWLRYLPQLAYKGRVIVRGPSGKWRPTDVFFA